MTTAAARTEEAAERLVAGTLGALERFSVHRGAELGLYRAVTRGPLTADELAGAAGIAPRYVREWLEQQAVAALLDVDGRGVAAGVLPREVEATDTRTPAAPRTSPHNSDTQGRTP